MRFPGLIAATCALGAYSFIPTVGPGRAGAKWVTLRRSEVKPEVRRMVALPESVDTDAGEDRGSIPIVVSGTNFDITPAIQSYVNQKIGKVTARFQQLVTKCEVHLTVNKNPRVSTPHSAEVTVGVKGYVVRSSERSADMYASIDLVADGLARKLRKYKERKNEKSHDSQFRAESRGGEGYEVDDTGDALEEFAAEAEQWGALPIDMSVVKSKSFNMEPISLQEAVMCLEYIDHDFYVFRNADTKEINVVYKRNHGGVGHIEPE